MAEMFNNLSGDSSAQYNNYNNVQGAKVNTGGKDGDIHIIGNAHLDHLA